LFYYFVVASHRFLIVTTAFAVDINASAHNLREIVVEKIVLKEDGCFALFEKRDDWGNITLLPTFSLLPWPYIPSSYQKKKKKNTSFHRALFGT